MDTNVVLSPPSTPNAGTETATNPAVTIALIGAAKDVLSAASWPIAILLIVLLLQKEIAKLLGSIKHLKFKDFEASVEREIEEKLSDEASEFSSDAEQKTGTTVEQMIQRGPVDAIISSWVRVETAIWELYRTIAEPGTKRPSGVSRMLSALLEKSLIDSKLWSSIRELQFVRNRTVHELDNSISPSALAIYVQSSLQVEAQLRDKLIGRNPH